MITILSSKEIDALSEEQKDAYARVVLSEARMRRALDSQARTYRGAAIVPVLLGAVSLGLIVWTPSLEFIVIIGLVAVAIALQWQAHGLNRRLDAVLNLLTHLEKRLGELEEEDGAIPANGQAQNRPKPWEATGDRDPS